MSKSNAEKRSTPSRKLSLNRETLRALSSEKLKEVAGGLGGTDTCANTSVEIYCGILR